MPTIINDIKSKRQDAVLYKADYWLCLAKDDPHGKAKAIKSIAKLISCIRDKDLRYHYVESIATNKAPHRIKFKVLNDQVEALSATSDDDGEMDDVSNWEKLPKYMSREELEMKGFCEVDSDKKVGYYGWGSNGKMEISNFIIKPLFHVRGKGAESRHIFEVKNSQRSATLDVRSQALVSIEILQTELVAEGGFIFFGNKPQLLRIANEILPHFPMCDEIKELGWQPEGFFAYVDSIFIPEKDPEAGSQVSDENPEYGLKAIGPGGVMEVFGKHFLIPAASSIFQDMREDIFEAQRVLSFRQSPVDFEKWAKQMKKVYGDDGLIGIAYILCTLFRDILFAIDHNFPHLYGYGERSSGKSKWAESLTAFFYKGRAAFNMNSGTDFAFFEYVRSFRNGLAQLNEFDDKVVKDEWFQAIKGFFDGEGRQKGKMGSRTGTQTQKAESGIILTGQYLSTKDDNSVVTRSIIRAFHERQFNEEEKANYDELKQWESIGLSSLIPEIIKYRSYVKRNYYEIFNDTLGDWRKKTSGEFNSRIFQNWCHLASMWILFFDKVALPVRPEVFCEIAYKNAKDLSNFVRSSDTLNEFWNTVVFLLDEGKVTNGWDFRIESWSEVKLRKGDGEEFTEQFGTPKKLLIIRLNNVHKHYQKAYKDRTGKEGMTIDNLKHYFSNRPYYIGQMKQLQFKKHQYMPVEVSAQNNNPLDVNPQPQIHNKMETLTTTTSAYVFDYDLLGCELDRGQ